MENTIDPIYSLWKIYVSILILQYIQIPSIIRNLKRANVKNKKKKKKKKHNDLK
jgi:hypothetical protein